MNYSYDDTIAPKGKTSIVMRYESPWKLWEYLEGDDYGRAIGFSLVAVSLLLLKPASG